VISNQLQISFAGRHRLRGSRSAVDDIHRKLIRQSPVYMDSPNMDLDLSRRDLAKIVCDEEDQNLAAE